MNKFSVGTSYSSKAVDGFIKSQFTEDFESSNDSKPNTDQVVAEDGTIYVLDSVGDVKESSKPTVKGQFKKPNLWRYGKPKAEVLHLNVPEELEQYNNIISGASGEDPSYYILESVREFWKGTFIVLITWCPVLYASLMRKTK